MCDHIAQALWKSIIGPYIGSSIVLSADSIRNVKDIGALTDIGVDPRKYATQIISAAARHNDVGMLKALIDLGYVSNYPKHCAMSILCGATGDSLELVGYMARVAATAPANKFAPKNDLVIHALQHGNSAIATFLMDDVESAEQSLVEASKRGCLDAVMHILTRVKSINVLYARAAISHAVQHGHVEVAQLMIQRGFSVAFVAPSLFVALLKSGHYDMARMLIANGYLKHLTAPYIHDIMTKYPISAAHIDMGLHLYA
jgi:hypothetical protein